MKKSIKIVAILVIALIMIMLSTSVFAVNVNEVIDKVDATDPNNTGNFMGMVNNVLGFLQWAAIIGGVLIITILGIKYMMGSLEERAEYKKSMIPLIVGIVIVMGATTIANILFNTFTVDNAEQQEQQEQQGQQI